MTVFRIALEPRRTLQMMIAVAVLVGCGGGGSSSSSSDIPVTQAMIDAVQLDVQMVQPGILVRCAGPSQDVVLKLQRDAGQGVENVSAACPGTLVLAGDYSLTTWHLRAAVVGSNTPFVTRSVLTGLPAPVVVGNGSEWVSVRSQPVLVNEIPGLTLTVTAPDGTTLGTFADPVRISRSVVSGDTSSATWRWTVTQGANTYTSPGVPELLPVDIVDLPQWGAMTMGDTNGDGVDELLGTINQGGKLQFVGYDTLGLGSLSVNRVFRDVREVDLNNDGLQDVVANVYGSGCTLIGLQRPGGGYDLSTPMRADGSCIGGNGETILVADFSGSGLPDIMLPSYQRVDYLHNHGDGTFTEEADARGLSFPLYRPTFEGTVAVDLDLDGAVDIAMGAEILLNDGTGHFVQMSQPIAPPITMQDEGLAILDADNDGVYDEIKLHPVLGLRLLWGQPDRVHFADAGQWTTSEALGGSNGLSSGDFTGNGLADLIVAGGEPQGTPPRVCVQNLPRQFTCLDHVLPTPPGDAQDISMLTDVDGDGQAELINRDASGMHVFATSARQRNVWRVDLRDALGRANMHGHSMRAICAIDSSLIQLQFVDGGSGYLAQRSYVVPFTSPWCDSAFIEVATRSGIQRYGPYAPGAVQIMVDPNVAAQTAAGSR